MPDMIPLSRSSQRQHAAELVRERTRSPISFTPPVAVMLVDLLDALAWVVLDRADLTRDGAREVLAVLWENR